jgi:hypothetical protein
MGFIWNHLPLDFGIDGEISVVDKKGKVRGAAVLTQVKATEVRFPGEDDEGFRFVFKEDHIDSWLEAGRPVIAVFVNLHDQQAWWKRLDTWFRDPRVRAKRAVTIEKDHDRFDGSTAARIAAAATVAGQPLPRLARTETVVSNLLEVARFAPEIHSAPTPFADGGEARNHLHEENQYRRGFMISGGRVIAMEPLTDRLALLTSGVSEAVPTTEWASSDDPDTQRHFVQLINETLEHIHHQQLGWLRRGGAHVTFYKAPEDLKAVKVKGRHTAGDGKTFFGPHFSHVDGGVLYYRHSAAELQFRRWERRWFLQIMPTYRYTIDGKQTHPWEADQLSGIKRDERNKAVFDWVRAWADYLTRELQDNLFAPRDERILFGDLARFEVDSAIDEKVWVVEEPDDGGLLDLIEGSGA